MIICGTGHRPDKLGGYSHEAKAKLVGVANDWLDYQQQSKIVTRVISGGALGWDQALAQAALDNNIPLTLALPFEGFECKWPRESQEYLHSLMNPADVMFVCEPGYAPWKMQQRNKWMVDNADRVVALWNGSSGGTANCVAYADKVHKPVVNLWSYYEHQS